TCWLVSFSMRLSMRRPTDSRSGLEPLLQDDGDCAARALADRPGDNGLPGQLVGAVAERHEGAAERVAVDGAAHLDQAAGAEELPRARPHDVGPSALLGAL